MSEQATPFDSIRQLDEAGTEYWSARDLAKVLGYKTNFRNFQPVIDKAMVAIVNSGRKPGDHIAQVRNMVSLGSGSKRQVEDFRLSRYACYLIVRAPVKGHFSQWGAKPCSLWVKELLNALPKGRKANREHSTAV